MSRYEPLWVHVAAAEDAELTMRFDEIEAVLGFPIDHSFLTYKKELTAYGRQVKKISMKEKWVRFERTGKDAK